MNPRLRRNLRSRKSKMDKKHVNTIIGYSGFILFEECYEYNEDACYLADSEDSVRQLMKACGYNKSDFRVDEISISMLMNDYGCSSGEYAMEQLAFENFKTFAKDTTLKYTYEDFDMDTKLKVVNL